MLVTGAASGIGAAVSARLTAGARGSTAPTLLASRAPRRQAWARNRRASRSTSATRPHGPQRSTRFSTRRSAWMRGELRRGCRGEPAPDTALAEWQRVIGINLDGAFLATKYCIRAMRATGGAIVHVGSASRIRPAAGAAAYSTSKAALRMLVQTAAKECPQAGWAIRIKVVSPAGVKTPMWRMCGGCSSSRTSRASRGFFSPRSCRPCSVLGGLDCSRARVARQALGMPNATDCASRTPASCGRDVRWHRSRRR